MGIIYLFVSQVRPINTHVDRRFLIFRGILVFFFFQSVPSFVHFSGQQRHLCSGICSCQFNYSTKLSHT